MLTLGGNCGCCCECQVCSGTCGELVNFNITVSGIANGAGHGACDCPGTFNISFPLIYPVQDPLYLTYIQCALGGTIDDDETFCYWFSSENDSCSAGGFLFQISGAQAWIYRTNTGSVRLHFELNINSGLIFATVNSRGYFDIELEASSSTADCINIDETETLSWCGSALNETVCTSPTTVRIEGMAE